MDKITVVPQEENKVLVRDEILLSGVSWCEANGVALRYQLTGSGENTLVLIHERGGTLESWSSVISKLPPNLQVLAYDMRGAGMSEKILGDIVLDDLVNDLSGLLEVLGITTRVAVAGVAMGAAVGIRLAVRFPALVEAIIAMAPACGISPDRIPATLAAAEKLESEGVRSFKGSGSKGMFPEQLRGGSGSFEAFQARSLTNDARSLAAMYRLLAHLDMDGDLAAIECPTLVIAGLLDPARPPADVALLARKIRNATFCVLPTGHYMPVLTPELVTKAIMDFLGAPGERRQI